MIKLKALSAVMALAVGLGGAPMVAQAQDAATGTQQQGAPTNLSATNISDAKIEAYAAAETQVQSISENVRTSMHQAETPDQRNQMQQQAQQQMVKVILEEGLSVPEYNMIARAAAQDPDLRSAIQAEK